MALPFTRTNFGLVEVATHYTAAHTVIALATSEGGRLPGTAPFPLVWWDRTGYPEGPDADPNREVTWVGSISGDTVVVSRGAESADGGGAASTKNTSGSTYAMLLGWTAKTVTEVEDRLVDHVKVNSAINGLYAPGSNQVACRVQSGADLWTGTQTTFTVREPLVLTAAASEGVVAGAAAYRESLPHAWITFNASLTLRSFNLTASRNAAGLYTLTFSRAASTVDYAVSGNAEAVNDRFVVVGSTTVTASQFAVRVINGSNTPADPTRIFLVVFGG